MSDPRGFTFIEIIVVLLIFSLAVAMITPKVTVGAKQMRERDFVLKVYTIMERARLRALNGGLVTSVVLDGENRRVVINGGEGEYIPEDVDIYGDGLTRYGDNYSFQFFPDGTSSARKLEIVFQKKKKIFIEVNPVTGSIHWYGENV